MLYVANVCCPIFISPWTTTGPNVSGFCNKHITYPASYNWINWQLDPIITPHTSSLHHSWSHNHTCHTPPLPILDHRQHTPPPKPFHCCFLSFRGYGHTSSSSYAHIGCKSILLGSLHKPIHTKLLISMSTHIINLSTTIPQVLVNCYPRTQCCTLCRCII